MTHARKQIRDAVVSQLDGLTLTLSNVFASRILPLDDATQMPALVVQTLSEEQDIVEGSFNGGIVKQQRVLNLEVVIHSRNLDGEVITTELDDIAEDVEDAIYGDKTLGGLVKDITYTGMDTVMEPESETPRGEMTLSFQVTYRIAEPASGTIIQ